MGSFASNKPLRIQTFDSKASVTVSAFSDILKSVQRWRDFKKVRSTETLVAGMAR